MTEPREREAFEEWARWSGLAFYLAWEQDRGYLDPDTWKASKAWQAGRAPLLELLKEAEPLIRLLQQKSGTGIGQWWLDRAQKELE